MKVLTSQHQCIMKEHGTNNAYLSEFPKGNKYKYMGEWFMFQEKYFTNVCIMIFTSKSGKSLIFKGLNKFIEI